MTVGVEGLLDGTPDGKRVGPVVGVYVVGIQVGVVGAWVVGMDVGPEDGTVVGIFDGESVGTNVGR